MMLLYYFIQILLEIIDEGSHQDKMEANSSLKLTTGSKSAVSFLVNHSQSLSQFSVLL